MSTSQPVIPASCHLELAVTVTEADDTQPDP